MRSWTLAFLTGVLFLQMFVHLPPVSLCGWLALVAVLIFYFGKEYQKRTRLPLATLIGFVWCLWYAHVTTCWTLPDSWQGEDVITTGYVASIPNFTPLGTSFLFSIKNIKHENEIVSSHGLLRLSWLNKNIKLHAGDKWQLTVHLKKPYGTMNPGGFDYEAYAFQEGIRGNGYVIDKVKNIFLGSHWYHYPINRMREYFKNKFVLNLPPSQTSPWITALAVGERQDIDQKDWQVLRNTGTNHLMAIAGLHIGLMAALAHFVVAGIWRRIPYLSLRIPAIHAGAVAALLMALTYSAMAGFSIPTQRASLMLTVFLLTLLMRKKIGSWNAWCCALLCMLVINPLTVVSGSFCLSFGSVALIIYGVNGRLSPRGLWWKWGRIQWVIALGLIPLSIGLFQQCSLVSFAANSVAIPVVAFLVVPLCLLACFLFLFSVKAGVLAALVADKILGLLWVVLCWFAHLPGMVWYQVVPHEWMLVVAIIGMVFLLFPIGMPGRWFGVFWLLPLGLFVPAVPAAGDVWFTVLDIGQGLSAVVQTQNHILVFDTGPRLGASFDMGDSVVMPFLHSINAHKVDMLVISHGDNDHIGGAKAVLAQMPVVSIKTSVPDKLPHSTYCLRGESWDWDGVNFSFLYPTRENLDLNNDSSCVLRITSGMHHILLTGDIEKFAEKDLLESQQGYLQADILVAPHHGSKTSALPDFVTSVRPTYVLFATGFRNRYHFPHPSVVKAYAQVGSIELNTTQTGAIQFRIDSKNGIYAPDLYRLNHQHYWNN
jgi:competence protein ComEC